MKNYADTFSGKLLLLVFDKIIIGAIVATAFFLFDKYKTEDARKYQTQQMEVQLQFERSRLVNEFLPVIQDHNIDLITRGYVLRSAVLARSLDADAAFELGQDFLRAGLSENHYKRIVSATLPDSIGAFARRGVQIAIEWHGSTGSFPRLDTVFNPVSGVEDIPEDISPFVNEGKLLREVLYENMTAFDGCKCHELTDEDQVPEHLYGLFVLLQASDSRQIDALSLRPEKALQVLGMMIRRWRRVDQESNDYLEKELAGAMDSEGRLRRASVLVQIMRWISAQEEGFGSPAFAGLLAKVATGQLPRDSLYAEEEGAIYWLRWSAAEAILLAGDKADDAVPMILEYLTNFRNAIASADGDGQLEATSIAARGRSLFAELRCSGSLAMSD